jgi:hypothetical protein
VIENGFPGDAQAFLMACYQHPDLGSTPLRLLCAWRNPALAAAAVKVEDVSYAKELDAAFRRGGFRLDVADAIAEANPRTMTKIRDFRRRIRVGPPI